MGPQDSVLFLIVLIHNLSKRIDNTFSQSSSQPFHTSSLDKHQHIASSFEMQRQESTVSDFTDAKNYIAPTRRTKTWKSEAGNKHAEVLAEYTAEAVPEPKEIHNFRTYLIGIIMCMGAAAYGCE